MDRAGAGIAPAAAGMPPWGRDPLAAAGRSHHGDGGDSGVSSLTQLKRNDWEMVPSKKGVELKIVL